MAWWIELHSNLRDHHKVERIAEDLKIPFAQALGHLCCLWLWAIETKPEGNLTGLSHAEIARKAKWEGKPEPFVAALTDRRWLDRLGGRGKGLKCHDWEVYARGVLRAITERERKRAARLRGRDPDSPRTRPGQSVQPDLTGPDRTGQTKPNPTGSDGGATNPPTDGKATTGRSKYAPPPIQDGRVAEKFLRKGGGE